MKRIVRAMVIAGIAAGVPLATAPAAMADITIVYVEKADIGHNGPTYVLEEGPGDLSFSSVTGSPKAQSAVGNEETKTGKISNTVEGGKGNKAGTEVEGSEQDQVTEDHGKKHDGKKDHGKKDHGKKHEAAGTHAEHADAKESDVKHADAKESDAKESGAREGAEPAKAHDKPEPKKKHIKEMNIGHNGPTIAAETGPGDLSFASTTGSPKAQSAVGNEAVKTGDISNTVKGGKGNAAGAEVEGSEQDQTGK